MYDLLVKGNGVVFEPNRVDCLGKYCQLLLSVVGFGFGHVQFCEKSLKVVNCLRC